MAAKKQKPNIRHWGNRWVVYFRRDGRQIMRRFKTEHEAELFLAEANLRRQRRQPEPALKRIRFRDFAREWLQTYAKVHVSTVTYRDYETALRVHLVPELGHLFLDQIVRRDLVELTADWASGGPRFQERVVLARESEARRAREEERAVRAVRLGCSAKTVSNAIVPLREMLGHAVEWGYIAANPAVGLKRPRENRLPESTMRVLDPEQVRRLLEAANPGLERTLLLTAVTTGARLGELRGMTWNDFDREKKRLWVRRSIGPEGVQAPKSRRSIRAIALTPTVRSALLEHRMASRFSDPSDLLFPSHAGTPLDPANVRRMLRATLKRAGLPPMRVHDLRHCYASLLVAQGAHPKFISEQLGHASTQITMDRYSHLLDQSYADESDKLEAALFGGEMTTPASLRVRL